MEGWWMMQWVRICIYIGYIDRGKRYENTSWKGRIHRSAIYGRERTATRPGKREFGEWLLSQYDNPSESYYPVLLFFRLIFGERPPETASEAAVTRRLRRPDGIPREERERNRDAESAFSMGRLGGDGLIGGGARVWRMGLVGTLRKDGRILWL